MAAGSQMTVTLDRAFRYWHTLRWLRPAQFVGRAYRLVQRPRIDARPAPETAQAAHPWMKGRRPASMLSSDRFRFLGVDGRLDQRDDWNHPARPKLWLYNLHYFDDLDAADASSRADWHRSLIDRWIRENPPGQGNGWEPYPSSLRIVNWIKWSLRTGALDEQGSDSLATQTRWLAGHIEYHLLGNHLWANAKALAFAGCFFRGREADQWLRRGTSLLDRELTEQILEDGGHFERSPMYHSIVLEDLLDLMQLDRVLPGRLPAALLDRIRQLVPRLLRWLDLMTHPDGRIALVNDAAFDIAPDLTALDAYARALELPSPVGEPMAPLEVMKDSGYIRVTLPGCIAILDVGAVGPDYLPGHAHADTLSFELTLGDERFLIDSGTSTYQPGPLRSEQRSTRAHNTVTVEGQDSSEVWGGFRVARRARVQGLRYAVQGDSIQVEASHDGYLRLPQKALHHRKWRFEPGRVVVEDELRGGSVRAEAHWHFGPRARMREQTGSSCHFMLGSIGKIHVDFPDARYTLSDGKWYPAFGTDVPIQRIDAVLIGGKLTTEINWREDPVPD